MPYSPPAIPVMTKSLTTMGAAVLLYPCSVVRGLRIPLQAAAAGIDGDDVRVERAHEHSPRHAAILRPQQIRRSSGSRGYNARGGRCSRRNNVARRRRDNGRYRLGAIEESHFSSTFCLSTWSKRLKRWLLASLNT